MTKSPIIPVILSGGSGTRLWPLSRRSRPKQFLPLIGDNSLFAETLGRVGADGWGAPLIVSADEHRFLVAECCRETQTTPQEIVLEPVPRNTAPAIATAALVAVEQDPDAVLLVLPSDHVIAEETVFREMVNKALPTAEAGDLVTFGVTPTAPETGYGYIRTGAALDGVEGGYRVDGFVEKPDAVAAEAYLADGDYLWNSGMFLFQAKTFLEELDRYHPNILACCRRAIEGAERDLDFLRLDAEAFGANEAISVDYAVMEKTERAAVFRLACDWNDVGSWSAIAGLSEADIGGNVVDGDGIVLDCVNTYVRSEKLLVAALGVRDLAIVATDDAVLVLPKDRAQEVGRVIDALKVLGREEAVAHSRVYRPWGNYQNLDEGDGFLVKQIIVNPGAQLSLQRHNHRAEHWVVVDGTARVTRGDEVFDLGPNQSTFIPLGAVHRIENPGDKPLRIIEVQAGDHISEDDIERLEDVYNRG